MQNLQIKKSSFKFYFLFNRQKILSRHATFMNMLGILAMDQNLNPLKFYTYGNFEYAVARLHDSSVVRGEDHEDQGSNFDLLQQITEFQAMCEVLL